MNLGLSPETDTRPLTEPINSLIHRPVSYMEVIDTAKLFPTPQLLEVEIGSGDGSFLIHHAQSNPDKNFLGIERLLGRLRKIDLKGLRAGLRNLCLLRIEASYCLDYLLPPGSVQCLHIYFPDPWPKRKHRKNRLVNVRFTEIAHKALADGGTVLLRTDDADYFAQMRQVIGANEAFRPLETPERIRAIPTDFERGFASKGVPTLHAAFQKSPG